jgi:predicted dehydrogenase
MSHAVPPSEPTRFTRRQVLKAGALVAASAPILRVRPTSAAALGDHLRIAGIGVGNKGWDDLNEIASASKVKFVALCDVDSNFLSKARETFKDAKPYRDYRKLLDEMGNEVDALTVSTPDHMHAAISLAAMSLGKHVYVQKPLAHNLSEMRQMMKVADESKVVTQMGTQIHSHEAYRTAVELVRNDAIGKVAEVYSWITFHLPLPTVDLPKKSDPVPANLDWKLWQGVAPERGYHEGYFHPFNWRMWRDYGCGALGDMACHLLDPLFTAMELRPPLSVVSTGPKTNAESFSPDAAVTWTFPATSRTTGDLKVHWFNNPPKLGPEITQMPSPDKPEGKLPGAGSVIIGERGVMLLPHVGMPSLYSKGKPMDLPIKSAGPRNHYHEWADACRGEGKTSTPFSYGGMVTESVLVGVVAGSFPKRPLQWNSAALKFDNPEATALVHRQYREGWRPLGL